MQLFWPKGGPCLCICQRYSYHSQELPLQEPSWHASPGQPELSLPSVGLTQRLVVI